MIIIFVNFQKFCARQHDRYNIYTIVTGEPCKAGLLTAFKVTDSYVTTLPHEVDSFRVIAVSIVSHYSSSSQRRSLTVTFPCCQFKWGPCGLDSYGWLRGERRACHNKVIARLAGFTSSGLATRSGLHSNG